jgi:hypothetical protein
VVVGAVEELVEGEGKIAAAAVAVADSEEEGSSVAGFEEVVGMTVEREEPLAEGKTAAEEEGHSAVAGLVVGSHCYCHLAEELFTLLVLICDTFCTARA